MANKSNIQNINLNGSLNLNKYKCEIKNFDGFNEKNSSIFGNVLTPFFSQNLSDDYFYCNNKLFKLKDYSLDKYALYKDNTLISTLPKYSVTKTFIKGINKRILAFDFDATNKNIIHVLVEGSEYYEMIDYNIETMSIVATHTWTIQVGQGVYFTIINNIAVFYDNNGANLWIVTPQRKKSYYFSNNGSPIVTFNKLSSSFDKIIGDIHYPRYLISYSGRSGDINVNAENGHNIIFYVDSEGHIHSDEVTLASTVEGTPLNSNQIPKFAPKVQGTIPIFYYVTEVENLNATNITAYMTATPTYYDEGSRVLTVTCINPITINNPSENTTHKSCATISPYFCSVIIGCTSTENTVEFDSCKQCFIGDCGYITNSNGVRYFPFGSKVDYSDMSLQYKYSLLINYGNVTNISVTLKSRDSNIGTVLNEWNVIDDNTNIVVDGYNCLYKNTDNSLSLVQIKVNEIPKYRIILNRYIIFETPHYENMYDTEFETFYHGFNDYNNRIFGCKKYGDRSIADFPTTYGLTDTFTYLYASAINPNMEVTNINFSSILYNPMIIEHGMYNGRIAGEWVGEFKECGEARFNETVMAYIGSNSTATVPTYGRSFTKNASYFDSRLNRVPYPVTTSGNILYSANIFSKFIDSYSNNDYIINDDVGYNLTYINNQPTLNYYFLSGIENIKSAFILQGINFVTTDKFIFQVESNGGILSYSQSLVNIEGFKFIGNTTRSAFFFSNLTKGIYVFSGDRSLERIIDCSSIDDIQNIYFNTREYKIYITTAKYIIVMDDTTMYSINIPNVNNITFSNDNISINVTDTYKTRLLSYTQPNGSFTRIPIKLISQYYGVGNNIKSTIDCIYIRLFNDYKSFDDIKDNKIKLNVTTLTEQGKQSEEKVFYINASDWDKETNTFYIRYQPKYQECMGMSIDIESPFAIATLDVGYSSDGTIQVSKYNM